MHNEKINTDFVNVGIAIHALIFPEILNFHFYTRCISAPENFGQFSYAQSARLLREILLSTLKIVL